MIELKSEPKKSPIDKGQRDRALGGKKLNAPGRDRTCNLRIRNPTLYPIELRELIWGGNRKGEMGRLSTGLGKWVGRTFNFQRSTFNIQREGFGLPSVATNSPYAGFSLEVER